MVDALQLRLGNYLLNTCRTCETIVKVSSINDHQIGCGIEGVRVNLCYEFSDYKPILLTRTMLAKLPQHTSIEVKHDNSGFFYSLSSGRSVRLQYLHQLQNLYYIVMGEELALSHAMIAAGNELASTTN